MPDQLKPWASRRHSPLGQTQWMLRDGGSILWLGQGTGLYLLLPGSQVRIEHPSASGTYSTVLGAETAIRAFLAGSQHADYPHQPGRLYDCPACDSRCHCTPGDAECVFEGEHNGKADPGLADNTLCANCGRTAAQAGCTLRTRVIDFRTEYMCDECVISFDWSDWIYDGVATYRHR